MTRVFVLAPKENWCVDQFVKDWYEDKDNADISVTNPTDASIIWCLADWCSDQIPYNLLASRKVLVTCHHFVPEKFDEASFRTRDRFVDAYHVYNSRTGDFIRPFTAKPIFERNYWANQHIWHRTGSPADLRKIHGLPQAAFLIGNFQRDTEGHDLKSPKMEKGPDKLADYLERVINTTNPNLHVVLAGWRRQYIINLDGGVQITASDGEARQIGAGEVILVEDVRGKGHLSKSIGGQMRHSIFVPIE